MKSEDVTNFCSGQPMDQNVAPPLTVGSAPRFLADRMVGKLARWLRILGYDTAYLPQLSPEGVIREGRRQGRIILTRDTRLLRRKDAPPLVFVRSDRFREQLRQVVDTCRLDPLQRLFTRCAECNQVLETVAKDDIRDRVPEYVWQTQEEFRRCPECRRLYWGATHRNHVLDELRRLGLVTEEGVGG
ncbi:MAG: Mut7-C RNAse domain-containing protein [Deltaproteobacteria bacterium]|nr:Mut7-C RNAse domain-containing protein [Deltaproteobacteria bacterium]